MDSCITTSGVFKNMKGGGFPGVGYTKGVHFQKLSNFSVFFTLNISTIFTSKDDDRRKTP